MHKGYWIFSFMFEMGHENILVVWKRHNFFFGLPGWATKQVCLLKKIFLEYLAWATKQICLLKNFFLEYLVGPPNKFVC